MDFVKILGRYHRSRSFKIAQENRYYFSSTEDTVYLGTYWLSIGYIFCPAGLVLEKHWLSIFLYFWIGLVLVAAFFHSNSKSIEK